MEKPDVIFRPWVLADKPDLIKHANNKKIFDNMRDMFPHPYTSEAADQFLSKVAGFEPQQVFAIEVNSEAVGSVGIFPQEDIERINAELGYWVAEEYWGNGIATKAAKFIIEYGFKTFPVSRIFAIPFPNNIASQKVLQNSDMLLEATIPNSLIKNNVIMDKQIYAIRRDIRPKF